jgi:hypothetical protein
VSRRTMLSPVKRRVVLRVPLSEAVEFQSLALNSDNGVTDMYWVLGIDTTTTS